MSTLRHGRGEALDEAQGQGASATGQADSGGEYSSAQGASARGQADSAQAGEACDPSGSHDVGMVMVAYDAGSSTEASRRKLCKK